MFILVLFFGQAVLGTGLPFAYVSIYSMRKVQRNVENRNEKTVVQTAIVLYMLE